MIEHHHRHLHRRRHRGGHDRQQACCRWYPERGRDRHRLHRVIFFRRHRHRRENLFCHLMSRRHLFGLLRPLHLQVQGHEMD